MFSEGIIGHELSNKQPLIAFTTVAHQICQPFVPQLSHTPRLLLQKTKPHYLQKNPKPRKQQAQYHKLLRVRPSSLSKLLNSNPLAVVEATFVHNIWSLFTALRDYVIRTEVVGGGFEVQERKFNKI